MTRLRVALRVPVGRPVARHRRFRRPLRRRGLRRRRHSRPSVQRPGCLSGVGAGGPGDAAHPAVPGHLEPRGSPSAGPRLARPQPGGNRAGPHLSHRGARFHLDAQRRASRARGWLSCATRSAISVGFLPGKRSGSVRRRPACRNRSATPTPVYLLAAGPRMIELAGEVADGAFLMVGLHPASIRAALRHLEAGARRAGRSLAGLSGDVRGHARPWIRRRGGRAMGAELVRARPAVPRLSERRESALAQGSRFRHCGNARSCGHPRGSRATDCRCIRTVRFAGTLRGATAAGARGGGRRGCLPVPGA